MMTSRLPVPDPDAAAHARHVAAHVAKAIAAEGPLPFDRYMDLVLYAPGLGYYSAGSRKFGAAGDFVTGPELGPAFAHALAHFAAHVAGALDGERWSLLEIGGGSGVLAADLLLALERRGCLPERYALLEISGELRARQRGTIEARCPHLSERVEWLDAPPPDDWHGVLVANEVIDALPASRFVLRDRDRSDRTRGADGSDAGDESGGTIDDIAIHEQYVEGDADTLRWSERPASPRLAAEVERRLGKRLALLPRPYRSELHLQLTPWLAAVTARLRAGAALFVDYGYPRHEYYSAERRDGTLVCHYRHHAHGDPLILPGLQDITAFVDFTALAEAAQSCGFDVAGYTSQAQFLLGNDIEGFIAAADALDAAGRMRNMNAVKRLMLPGQMGERFQAMALTRGLDATLPGFDHDLRYRLYGVDDGPAHD
jgi:SAM-dependent MidA family methyltransferase